MISNNETIKKCCMIKSNKRAIKQTNPEFSMRELAIQSIVQTNGKSSVFPLEHTHPGDVYYGGRYFSVDSEVKFKGITTKSSNGLAVFGLDAAGRNK